MHCHLNECGLLSLDCIEVGILQRQVSFRLDYGQLAGDGSRHCDCSIPGIPSSLVAHGASLPRLAEPRACVGAGR